jgi:ribose 5-phosphate isomerase A
MADPRDAAKTNAAREALAMVEPGMVLGLGTGSTAAIFVRLLAEKVSAHFDIVGVPTSEATYRLARQLGVRIVSPDDVGQIDLTIDGADEFDGALRLIKGGGAALLREKIIAEASDRMVVIADASKQVARLGKFPLPIEINPFAAELTRRRVMEEAEQAGVAGALSTWRMATGETLLHTDGGHLVLDLACGSIPDPEKLAEALDELPGVVEHGLFLGLCDEVVIGLEGGAKRLCRDEAT